MKQIKLCQFDRLHQLDDSTAAKYNKKYKKNKNYYIEVQKVQQLLEVQKVQKLLEVQKVQELLEVQKVQEVLEVQELLEVQEVLEVQKVQEYPVRKVSKQNLGLHTRFECNQRKSLAHEKASMTRADSRL